MSTYPSTNPLPISSNTDVETTINGYKWNFLPGSLRVINWSVSGSKWNHQTLSSSETQDDFNQVFSNIGYYINASFNFMGYFSTTNSKTGYQIAYESGSNMNISLSYNGFTANGQWVSDAKFQSTSDTAFCNFPTTLYDSNYVGAAGDTWLNWNNSFIQSRDFEQGSNGFALVLHEVLHGLGLKHPFDDGGTGRPTYQQLNMAFADRQWISVMSYDKFDNGGDGAYSGSMPIAPMIMDVIALQYLYGESVGSAGNTTLDLSSYVGTYFNTLWDSSGTDTLDAGKLRYGIYADMGLAKSSNGSSEHHVGYITSITDEFYLELIGFNPSGLTWLWGEYENLNGSPFDDTVDGNDLDNVISGGNGNDTLRGGAGNDTFDWDPDLRGGADTFEGGPGNDTYVMDSFFDKVVENSLEGIDKVFVGYNYSLEGTSIEDLSAFSNMTIGVTFSGNSYGNKITGGAQGDQIFGYAGDDSLRGDGGNDTLNGGLGIDTSVFSGGRSNFTISKTALGLTVRDNTGIDGIDSLVEMERLSFSSNLFAFDVTPSGNAGKSLEFIGMLAYDMINTATVVGTILSIFDQGKSMKEVCQLAINAGLTRNLAGSTSNLDLAKLVFRNVVGSEASSGDAAALASYIQGNGGSMTQADFLATIAQLDLNNQHIGLAGLQSTGIEYII